MDHNQIKEFEEALAKGTDKSLNFSSSENSLTLIKSNGRLEYLWWLVLIIGVPIYYLWKSPSIQALIITSALSLSFIYLIYDGLLATNKLVIDLTIKELTIVPNDRIAIFLGLVKDKKVGFNEVKSTILIQKSNGKGQAPGRRLFIETNNGKALTAIDFRNSPTAEVFNQLLTNIINR